MRLSQLLAGTAALLSLPRQALAAGNTRESFDRRLMAEIDSFAPALVVLAGFMRILDGEFVRHWQGRLLNIHPSLLPSFRGARAVEQALAAGVQISGCTAHLVSLEVDTGPILVQAAVPVLEADTVESLSARIHAQEHRILPLAVQLAAARRSGVKHYFIEDESASSVEQIPQSLKYLEGVRW